LSPTTRRWRARFIAARDRFTFLELLERTVARFSWSCLSYCLMDNHIHLVVRTPHPNLSRGMQQLKSAYAQVYRRRYGGEGALYAGRFKSVLVQRDAHLLEVFRYVALNPVRAGACAHPSAWPWSAHREIAGHVTPAFVAVDEVLSYFAAASGADSDVAFVAAYRVHGYTMASIAREIGCHVSTVSRWIRAYETRMRECKI
jgi:REP element-mobilizing transposase RayT